MIIKFDYTASGSVAIKNADGTVAASLSVSVILATNWAGTINNQVQTINYNTPPAESRWLPVIRAAAAINGKRAVMAPLSQIFRAPPARITSPAH